MAPKRALPKPELVDVRCGTEAANRLKFILYDSNMRKNVRRRFEDFENELNF